MAREPKGTPKVKTKKGPEKELVRVNQSTSPYQNWKMQNSRKGGGGLINK